jgi:thiol-disulfide isomerase/thioredoxin
MFFGITIFTRPRYVNINQIRKALLVLFVLGSAWAFYSRVPTNETDELVSSPRVGFLAPDFSLERLESADLVTLSNLRGKVILVNIWASWCPPCREEMPAINRVYQEYESQGFEVLAVNTTYQDNEADAAAFAQNLGLTFPILLDRTGEISQSYLLRGLPSSYFIDREGIIRSVVVGGPMTETLIRTKIQELLELAP